MIDKKNLINEDIESDDDFEDAAENLIYSMRVHAEFYGYGKLMEMLKEYCESKDKDAYLNTIDLNVNPQLAETLTFGPSKEMLQMIFDWLSSLDVDFLVQIAKLVNNEERAALFEGMIYMGIASEEEDEEVDEEVDEGN
jgi:hypothetical protein